MFTSALLAFAFGLVSVVKSDPVPLEPHATSVFNEGTDTCLVQWTPDPTGKWTTMYIELMTGDNFQQVHLKTVATVDGTNSANSSFTYTCPSVTPNSAIYFYKFSTPADPTDLLFTTRFTIAGANGETTPPTASETATDGTIVAYGTGALTDPSQGDQPPNLGNGTTVDTATSAPASTGTDGSDSSPTGSNVPTTTRTSTLTSTTQTGAGDKILPSLALGVAGAFAAALFL